MTALSLTIAANADDGFARAPSAFNASSVQVGDSGAAQFDNGSFFRYLNVTIPNGATITSATLTLRATNTPAAYPATTLSLDAADNATAPTSGAGWTSRVRTTANAAWTPTAWAFGVFYTSPSFAAAVQEVVNRPGWASGNALLVLWDTAVAGWGGVVNNLQASDYSGNPTLAAVLDITYTTGAPAGPGGSFLPFFGA